MSRIYIEGGYLTISVNQIIFDTSADLRIQIVLDNGFSKNEKVIMAGEDYLNWKGADLPYVKNFVLDKLGLVEVEEIIEDGYGEDYYGSE